jgi:hypothetical protein
MKVALAAREDRRSRDTSPARLLPTLKKTSVSVQAAEAIKALVVAGELSRVTRCPPSAIWPPYSAIAGLQSVRQ